MRDDERDELVDEIVAYVRHVDRLDEIPGARVPLPLRNPLWDIAGAIEQQFKAPAR